MHWPPMRWYPATSWPTKTRALHLPSPTHPHSRHRHRRPRHRRPPRRGPPCPRRRHHPPARRARALCSSSHPDSRRPRHRPRPLDPVPHQQRHDVVDAGWGHPSRPHHHLLLPRHRLAARRDRRAARHASHPGGRPLGVRVVGGCRPGGGRCAGADGGGGHRRACDAVVPADRWRALHDGRHARRGRWVCGQLHRVTSRCCCCCRPSYRVGGPRARDRGAPGAAPRGGAWGWSGRRRQCVLKADGAVKRDEMHGPHT